MLQFFDLKAYIVDTMLNKTKLFWVITAITISWMLMMRPYTPANIVAFELAKAPEKAFAIMSEWGIAGIAKARLSIYLDFGFLILYSLSISLGCNIAARFSAKPVLMGIGVFFAKVVWLAGIFDVIENGAMLITLKEINASATVITFYCATIKFSILAIAMLYILLATFVGIANLLFAKKSTS